MGWGPETFRFFSSCFGFGFGLGFVFGFGFLPLVFLRFWSGFSLVLVCSDMPDMRLLSKDA